MPACLITQNGKLFFAAENVLLGFNPLTLNEHALPPHVTITDFQLFNRRLPVDSLLSLKAVWFPYDQNSFTLSFAALSFLQKDKLVYYYKLDGADKDWIRAGQNLTVNYNLLPPGSYTFMVRCENAAGISSKNITRMAIFIKVPFWLSWWFILLCCALFAGTVYLIYRQQIRNFMMVERVRQKVARDLHDDMGSVLSTINILSMMAKNKLGEDMVKTSEFLGKISDNSSRMMEAMDDIVWSINPANDSMDKIVARMRGFATEVLEAKEIDLNFNVDGKIDDIHLDMEQRRDFFLIYKEAVNNIAKYARCKKVDIVLELSQKKLLLQIKDDGIGFHVEEADSGNGLSNMQKRAENLGGTFSIRSQPSIGTTVRLEIEIT
jgi:signal transduction histidine kinase